MIIVGNLRKRNNKITLVKCFLGICTGVIQPIQLQYELVTIQLVKKKLLIMGDVTMSPNFEEVVMKIKCLEEEIVKHRRLQLGLETIFQMTGNAILISYSQSTTRARQGLSSLFGKGIDFMGFSLSPELVIGGLLAINLMSFIKVQMNGTIKGYASNYAILGKVALLINIICSTMVRIASMTLYFSTTLGLFDLLGHYQGKNYQIV